MAKHMQAELTTNMEEVSRLENEMMALNDELKKYKKMEE